MKIHRSEPGPLRTSHRKASWRSALATAILLATCAALPAPATAIDPPPPGTIIDGVNVNEWKEFFGPGMLWVVDRGLEIKVSEHRRLTHTPPFIAATEKYSGQVRLSEDGTHIIAHVAGLPFPTVDANDPMIATKRIFNFNAAIAPDDSDIRNFDCDTGAVGSRGDRLTVERHFLIDHIRRLYMIERTEVEPIPAFEVNIDQARFKEALYPLIEPFDLKGVGFTMVRHLDHTKHDNSWLYLPALRRVRRLSSAQRSDALFGQDTDADSYEGYQGNPAWMEWRYLGEKTILGTMNAEHLPVKWAAPSADFMHDDKWEPRDVWIVAGKSKLPQYAYSKRIIYIDKEVHRIPYTEMYDHAGELWKMWVNNYKFATHPRPGAQYGSEWEVAYRPSITMVDMQLEHATHCSLPSDLFPEEQGWYVNLGEEEGTTEDFFALSAIIAAGR